MIQDHDETPDEQELENEEKPSTSSAKPGYSDDPPRDVDSRYSSQDESDGKDYDSSQGERE